MIDSVCGLHCTGCSYKETHHCMGCIETGGVPFHGVCPVAKCAIGKSISHCGECSVFPCDLLTSYSCDKEHGDNGERIEECRRWCLEADKN